MYKRNTLSVTFKIEEVSNGFVLIVGHSIETGLPSDRYVFNTVEDLNDFMNNYIEERA